MLRRPHKQNSYNTWLHNSLRMALVLGHVVAAAVYQSAYDASILCPIPRAPARQTLLAQYGSLLPFTGCDLWTGYELSWLNPKGKPLV